MSHNNFIRPGGTWYGGVPVLHGELTQMDQTLFECLNGDRGGTWSPSSVITIGGAGLNVTADFFANGFCNINSNASIGSSPTDVLDVFSTSTFHTPASFAGLTTTTLTVASVSNLQGVNCTNLAVSGAASTGTTMAVGTGLTVGTTLAVSGTTTLQAASTAGVLTLAGGASITSVAACSGAGRVVRPMVIGATSGGGTASAQQASVYYFPTLAANETYTLSNTGVQDGDEIRFTNASTAFTLSVNDPGGSLINSLINTTGNLFSILVKYSTASGTWSKIDFAKV